MNRKLDRGPGQLDPVGYSYYVSEEQLAQYAALTILERLTWLDQARRFVLLAQTEQAATRRGQGYATKRPERMWPASMGRFITVGAICNDFFRKVPEVTDQNQNPVKKGEVEGPLILGRVR